MGKRCSRKEEVINKVMKKIFWLLSLCLAMGLTTACLENKLRRRAKTVSDELSGSPQAPSIPTQATTNAYPYEMKEEDLNII